MPRICNGCHGEITPGQLVSSPEHFHISTEDLTKFMKEAKGHNNRRYLRMKLLIENPYCYYCGQFVHVNYSTIDHKAPKSKFAKGARLPKVLTCPPCNSTKSDMWASDFKRLLNERTQPWPLHKYENILTIYSPSELPQPRSRKDKPLPPNLLPQPTGLTGESALA